jgi:hypothetical protein
MVINDDALASVSYWQSRSSSERMAKLERLRQEAYGYDPATTRLERVLEIIDLSTGRRNIIDCRNAAKGANHDD